MPRDSLRRLKRIKANLERRMFIYEGMRSFFRAEGFLEVETPLRVPVVAPEQFIMPQTSDGWYLSTSPELQMKRLLSAGYQKIFQICQCFRQGERGRYHNPEFSMIEWYRASANYSHIINDTERLVLFLAEDLGMGSTLNYLGKEIDLSLPWQRVTVREAFLGSAGWDPVANYDPERFDIDLVDKVIPCFAPDRPTVLLDYPAPAASLSRLKTDNPLVAERAEIFIGGLELSNGYSELTDAAEQERRFKLEIEQMKREGKPAALPRRFLRAIKHLPPCSGNALGVDRLVMLFCNTDNIDDVIAFPSDIV